MIEELIRRRVLRSRNSPSGDYAEYLIARYFKVVLPPPGRKTWDLVDSEERRIQVKARVQRTLTPSERELGIFRSWDFDVLAVVLFNSNLEVSKATLLPKDVIFEGRVATAWARGDKIFATDELLSLPDATDITARLQELSRNEFDAVERHPSDYPWKQKMQNVEILTEQEGGTVYSATGENAFWIIYDEGSLSEYLDEDEDLLPILLRLERYDSQERWAAAVARLVDQERQNRR